MQIAWSSKAVGKLPTWSISRDQVLQTCERKYYFQYLSGARINSADPLLRGIAMLKKLKNIAMWRGECVHWTIAQYLSGVRVGRPLSRETLMS